MGRPTAPLDLPWGDIDGLTSRSLIFEALISQIWVELGHMYLLNTNKNSYTWKVQLHN